MTQTIGIIGGTGPQGRGLALRWGAAGREVVIGSRSAERAEAVAAELGHGVRGAANADCAAESDIVVITVPWDGHAETLADLAPRLRGTLVVDSVNPLGFDKQGPYALSVPEGSAAQQAAALLPDSTVTAAFHHVSAVSLADLSIDDLALDVLVLGEDRDAIGRVIELVDLLPGMRGVYGGRLRNAHQVEALTANLIAINRRYKAHAGIRVTDV
ncbi:NADPH-dependent F420 reductase [Solicola gregarius]|uniref:NADPH-dependent F420 reductase n=1 Tax=Solicola gregarius TaxID=2908642 RepID=A0AA46THU3_9ACTN|nr:NADPH-dependent F420 reductase [Solicola gregarius]UYM05581.1 NADPH-dependent F420 reductase [Solicola gregarius]